MRRLALILITLCALPLVGNAQSVNYFQGTVYEALSAAERSSRMLVVEFYAPWSYKSRWMHDNVLAKSDLDADFVICAVDTRSEQGATLANQYEVTDYPNILIFNANGNVIDRIDKALSLEDFSTRLAQITITTDSRSTWQLRQIFDAAERGDREQTDKLMESYVISHKPTMLTTPTHWDLFVNSDITYYGSTAYMFLKTNRTLFADTTQVDELLNGICIDAAMPYVIGVEQFNPDHLKQIASDAANDAAIEKLCDLALLRHQNNYYQYVQTLENVIDMISEKYEYPLIMSLDFVAEGSLGVEHKLTRRSASALLEKLYIKTTSPAKISLIKPLLDKFL